MIDFKDGLSPRGVTINGEWYATDYRNDKTIEDRLHNFFNFARERHAIYLRRASGKPKPWTNDPILRANRFCNVYRELDTVSQWVINKIIVPYENDDNLWFYLCAARIINWPDSLQAMMDRPGGFGFKGKYDPDVAFKALMDRRAQKLKTITGAYIVNSVTKKTDPEHIQGNKLAYIAYRTLGEIWQHRGPKMTAAFKDTLQNSVETLKKYQGYGPFMAYQITVDLSYSWQWLKKAHDINTFNSAGPGTCRGLSRVFHNEKFVQMEDKEKTKLLAFQLKASHNPSYWPNTNQDMKKGFAPLSMSNLSNCNCEYDKWSRMAAGSGKMRSKYPGELSALDNQKSLF